MRSYFLLILLSLSASLSAQTAVYEFLRLDRSARVAALGGNSVSMKGDIVGLFQNPASISSETDKSASFSFQKNLMDINAGFIAYGREIKGIGEFGVGFSYINYGTFMRADAQAIRGGEFTAAICAYNSATVANLKSILSALCAAALVSNTSSPTLPNFHRQALPLMQAYCLMFLMRNCKLAFRFSMSAGRFPLTMASLKLCHSTFALAQPHNLKAYRSF